MNLGEKELEEAHLVSPSDAKLIQDLNAADVELYEAVQHRFGLFVEPEPATQQEACYTGNIGGVRNGKIVGWAVNRRKEVPVEISIFINGKEVGHTLANRFRPDLKKAGIKRNGCGGVLFGLGHHTVKDGDSIEFRVKETRQVVARKQLTGDWR